MIDNPFRRNLDSKTKQIFRKRSDFWVDWKEGNTPRASFKDSAYAVVTRSGVTISTLNTTFESLYPRSDTSKPNPRLDEVVVERRCDSTSQLDLTLTANITFTCFVKSDFDYLSSIYCIPYKGTQNDYLSLEYGHVDPEPSIAGINKVYLDKLSVVYGTWSYSEPGVWTIRVKAIGMNSIIKDLDIKVNSISQEGSTVIKQSSGHKNEKVNVLGFEAKLLFDAQSSGILSTDDVSDGHVINNEIVIYKPPVKKLFWFISGKVKRSYSVDEDSTTGMVSKNLEYFTLEYLVNLINKYVLEDAKNAAGISDTIKIKFLDEPYTYLPERVVSIFKSCDPLIVLLLGGNRAGSYTCLTDIQRGKDFEKSVNIKAIEGNKINHKKILFERAFLNQVFSSLQEKKEKAENKDKQEGVYSILNVNNFFKSLFEQLKILTGTFVSLELVCEDEDNNSLVIIDSTSKEKKPTDVLILDPVNSDNNTRSVSINAEPPSDDYAASIFSNMVASKVVQYINKKAANDSLLNLSLLKFQLLMSTDLPKDLGNSENVEAAIELLKRIRSLLSYSEVEKINILYWASITMEATLDGLAGFKVGNLISSTSMPEIYSYNNHIVFTVREIIDSIRPHDWSTQLRAVLSISPNIPTQRTPDNPPAKKENPPPPPPEEATEESSESENSSDGGGGSGSGGGSGGGSVSIKPGTLAAKNNNPGNLKFAGQKGAVEGEGGFAKFESPQAGYDALKRQIELDKSRNLTLEQFINKFAPPSENDTSLYIKQATDNLNVPRDTVLNNISTESLAKFMAMKESSTKIG